MESFMFGKFRPDQLLNKSWQKRQTSLALTPGPTPNVRALIRYSNQLSNLVGMLILEEPNLKKRTHIIGHLINVANAYHALKNYSAVVSILAGFQSAPIYRLVRTWTMATERSCNMLAPLQAHFKCTQLPAYGEALRIAIPPCIPFIGLFLKDLTFIEDGNPTCTPEELVNFSKCTMLASTVHEIRRFQASYFLQTVPELQDSLKTQLQSAVQLQELWGRSCELEPRGREVRPRNPYAATGGMTTSTVVACMILDD